MPRSYPWKCETCLVHWTGISETCWHCGGKGTRRKEVIIPGNEPRSSDED